MTDKTEKKAPESKAEKFKRLGVARLTVAGSAIDKIAQLASKQYEHTPEQAEKLIAFLDQKVQAVKDAFAGKVAKTTIDL